MFLKLIVFALRNKYYKKLIILKYHTWRGKNCDDDSLHSYGRMHATSAARLKL